MEQNCLSAQSKNVYLNRKFKKIIITNTNGTFFLRKNRRRSLTATTAARPI